MKNYLGENVKMKQIGKTKDKELVQRFLDAISYQWAVQTGNTRAMITHYGINTDKLYGEEIAQVSYNFDTKTYICRIAE